jgi:hypothetical protein
MKDGYLNDEQIKELLLDVERRWLLNGDLAHMKEGQ